MLNTIPWEQRKLGDICNITTGKLDANAMVENGKYDFFTSGIKKYKIDHYAFLGPALTIAGNGATVGYMHYADGFFNAYQRTYVLTELLGDRTFLFSTINRKLQKKIQQEARAGNIPYIVLDMLTELDIYLPSLEEQTQIGNFFKQLDDTIALHQRTLEKYQKLKISYLEKMFPKGNELYPELRFPNFTDAWEQRKLGDLAHTFIGGGTPATNNIEFWDGSIPWLQSSDLIEDIVFNIIPRKFISKKALKKSATKLIPSNSITIVTRVGVGKLALIPYEFATSQDFISFSELKLDLIFASYAFYRLMKEESKSTQGTSIKGITKEVILNKYIYVPKSKEEQTQIGNFFKQLDDTIALHQREVEKYKKIKQSYLEKMFI